jgi:hypothetical protein
MSVGGRLIEIAPHILRDGPDYRKDVIRLWVVDRNGDETIVYAEPTSPRLPVLGEEIWWHGRTIFFDGDSQQLIRVGYSHSPPKDTTEGRRASSRRAAP